MFQVQPIRYNLLYFTKRSKGKNTTNEINDDTMHNNNTNINVIFFHIGFKNDDLKSSNVYMFLLKIKLQIEAFLFFSSSSSSNYYKS